MSFLQPMNFDSAFRPVPTDRSSHPNGVANRAQLCRGNDAKCCRRAGQRAVPVGTGAELVWDDSAFCCPCCKGCGGQCGCQNACNDCDNGCSNGRQRSGCDNDCDNGCDNDTTYVNRRQRSGCDNDCDTTYTTRRQRSSCDDCDNDCDTTYTTRRQRSGCDNDCDTTYTTRRQRSSCDNDCDNDCDTAYTSRRQRSGCDNDCDNDCDSNYTSRRQRSSCDDCDNDCDSTQTAGMVYHVEQDLEKLFCGEQAIQAGTAYPELYKPMNCADDPATNCPSCQQEKAFLLWELRLYLDTHPCDKKVLRLYRQLARELGDPNYASTFDEDDCDEETWNWVGDPWPWESHFQRSKN